MEPDDLGHPLAIDPVVEDEHALAMRKRRHQRGLDSGSP